MHNRAFQQNVSFTIVVYPLLYKDNEYPFQEIHDLMDNKASLEEKAQALDTCSAYCGSYQVDGELLFMNILCGSFPNWIGKVQKRHCVFEGNKFIATTEPRISGGKEVIVTVIWEKV